MDQPGDPGHDEPITISDHWAVAAAYSALLAASALARFDRLAADIGTIASSAEDGVLRKIADDRWQVTPRRQPRARPPRLDIHIQGLEDANVVAETPAGQGAPPVARAAERARAEAKHVEHAEESQALRALSHPPSAGPPRDLHQLRRPRAMVRTRSAEGSETAALRAAYRAVGDAHDPSDALRGLAATGANWALLSWLRLKPVRSWLGQLSLSAPDDGEDGRPWTEHPALGSGSPSSGDAGPEAGIDEEECLERAIDQLRRYPPGDKHAARDLCIIELRWELPTATWEEVAQEVRARGHQITAQNAKQILNRRAKEPGLEYLELLKDHRKGVGIQAANAKLARRQQALQEAREAYEALREEDPLTAFALALWAEGRSWDEIAGETARRFDRATAPRNVMELVRGYLATLAREIRSVMHEVARR